MCIAEYNENIYLVQGSRGIRGPQGAVGKKGENVSGKKNKNKTQVAFREGAK